MNPFGAVSAPEGRQPRKQPSSRWLHFDFDFGFGHPGVWGVRLHFDFDFDFPPQDLSASQPANQATSAALRLRLGEGKGVRHWAVGLRSQPKFFWGGWCETSTSVSASASQGKTGVGGEDLHFDFDFDRPPSRSRAQAWGFPANQPS